jgi:hypothetical protein
MASTIINYKYNIMALVNVSSNVSSRAKGKSFEKHHVVNLRRGTTRTDFCSNELNTAEL